MPNEDHHRIRIADFKEQIAKLPDDSRIAFMADEIRCQFLGIVPSDIPGVEGVFVIRLRPLPHYPPVAP